MLFCALVSVLFSLSKKMSDELCQGDTKTEAREGKCILRIAELGAIIATESRNNYDVSQGMFCETTQNTKSILNQILAGLQMLQPQDIRLRNAPDSPNLSQVLFRQAEVSF